MGLAKRNKLRCRTESVSAMQCGARATTKAILGKPGRSSKKPFTSLSIPSCSTGRLTGTKRQGPIILMEQKQRRFLEKALRRMFRVVGCRYTREAVGKPEWFYSHSWTIEQERKFAAWYTAEGIKDLGWNRRYAAKQARWFILFHGWRLEFPPEEVTKASRLKA